MEFGSSRGVASAPAEPESSRPAVPASKRNDGVLVPLDQWTSLLNQLGNLHQAGQQLAEARERAAKAETEARFFSERLKEMRAELTEARSNSSQANSSQANSRIPLRPSQRRQLQSPLSNPHLLRPIGS